jgi:hypothetical protein
MDTSFPIRAVLLSLVGAVLGASLWLLIAISANLEQAVPALLIGVMAGAATRIEPRRGPPVQIIALIATAVGLIVAQYFIVRHAVVNELVDTGRNRSIPILLSPAAMWSVTFGWLRAYPLNIALWAASATAAFLLPLSSSEDVEPSDAFLRGVG